MPLQLKTKNVFSVHFLHFFLIYHFKIGVKKLVNLIKHKRMNISVSIAFEAYSFKFVVFALIRAAVYSFLLILKPKEKN